MRKKIYALGFFDGVHLGHQALLRECCRLAQARNCVSAAVTFSLPPMAVVRGQAPNVLTTVYDRVALLKEFGMDEVVVYPTNAETLSMPWQDFLAELVSAGAVGFVCGHDFRFGANGEGTAEMLQAFSEQSGFACTVVPEQTMDGARISSTRIRGLLEQGAVAHANRLLGHPYYLTGTVVAGQKLGRTIGIPTANLPLPEDLLPLKFGVYACRVWVDNAQYLAVTNVGTRPTVMGKAPTIEAFLLDFDGDLYGKTLKIAFYDFLRTEKKFASLEELQAEIQENVLQTRQFFEKNP